MNTNVRKTVLVETLETINDGVFVSDKERTLVYVNRALCEMTGFEASNLIGVKTPYPYWPEDENGSFQKFFNSEGSQIAKSLDFTLKRKNGWRFPVKLLQNILRNQEGAIEYYIHIVRDITDLMTTKAELNVALNDVLVLKRKYERENIYLREEISKVNVPEQLVFASNGMTEVMRQVKMVAFTGATVLIQGETGTGKELIAKSIHEASNRRDHHMIKVNCGAIPAELIESELFGHKKGAFTDAFRDRTGKFELADGGTLFLDEIGELPLELQPKLLRVLQECEIQPLGSSETLKVDVRIIAATNKDLKEEVQNQNFREDLYFRLNVFPIQVPPLRQRREDIPILINHFVVKYSKKHNKSIKHILKSDVLALKAYDWPGNVRELENSIERSVIVSGKNHLLFDFSDHNPGKGEMRQIVGLGKTLDDVQHDHIVRILELTNWRISGPNGAALILNINPSTLRDRMKKLGIKKR